ncbi:MAG: glutamate racemase [Chloroflexota bacterium]
MADRRAIGMFDSGVGGLSVMREIRRLLSREDILYLADTAHCPYGTRTREEIQQLTGAIAEFLISQGAKLIVVACNTASVASLPYLRAKFSVPFVGMVPAVKPAASASQARRVGVMATNATFQGEMFDDLVQRFAADVQVVKQVCPGLVHAVEKGELDTVETKRLLAEYVQPLVEARVDTIVLGCTHYVFLRSDIEEIVGPAVAVIDSGQAVARQVARVLRERGLENTSAIQGQNQYFTTGDAEQVAAVISRLTGEVSPAVASVRLSFADSAIIRDSELREEKQ